MTLTRPLCVFLWLLVLPLSAQDATTARVRVYVLTEIGTPLYPATVRIDGYPPGSGPTRTIELKGPGSVDLPLGVYVFLCSHRTFASVFRVVRVESTAPLDVVMGLPLNNPPPPADGFFAPFEVHGRVVPPPEKSLGHVKVIGILTDDGADSVIDDQGRFRVLLGYEGVYRFLFICGKSVVAERTVDLTYAMSRQLEINVNAGSVGSR
jgi:hypothetical protein